MEDNKIFLLSAMRGLSVFAETVISEMTKKEHQKKTTQTATKKITKRKGK